MEINRDNIVEAIYNELVHSAKLHHWEFRKASYDLLERLIKLGVIDVKFKKEENQEWTQND